MTRWTSREIAELRALDEAAGIKPVRYRAPDEIGAEKPKAKIAPEKGSTSGEKEG